MSSTPELSTIPWVVRKQRNKRPHLPWSKAGNTLGNESSDESKKTASQTTDSPSQSKPKAQANATTADITDAVAARKVLGHSTEQAARQKLESHGLVWVCSNFRCKVGEIDLIMRDGNQAVVVEVRTRSNSRHGTALESIGHHKQRKISKAALYWWTYMGQQNFKGMRFDAIGVDTAEGSLTWVKNAWMLD